MSYQSISRRQFLRLGTMSSGALLLAACGASSPEESVAEVAATAPAATLAPVATSAASGAANGEAKVIVGDVVDFALSSDQWPGSFGSVTFELHEGVFDGQSIYYIRTDASEPAFAEENGLVFVPLLNAGKDFAAPLYLFEDDRLPVFATSPGEEEFTSLFQLKTVTVIDDSADLSSAAGITAAADAGGITIEEHAIFVNYPVVKWPGGELSVDDEKAEYLGTGQLLEPVDTSGMTVTFKLHECYPGSRYIVTDTSAAPMAPMMSISAAPPTQALKDNGGADEIWVFANGIEGSGVMGFQPAIFDNQAGHAAWSPFWNHFTLKWADGVQPRLLESSIEVRQAIDAGDVELFNGTPDSHPNGFVVNCPVPVLAENTFSA